MGKHAAVDVEIETHDLPLSALQREKQRLAYVLAVDNIARTLAQMVRVTDGVMKRAAALADRVDALERDAAVGRAFRSASFTARLRWLVGL